MSLLFERFISRERNEPPDIDVDFEHERREEVIQYIYAKYGRDRAALTATVICYRPRSALRDVAKALGLDAAAGRCAGALDAMVGRSRRSIRRGCARPASIRTVPVLTRVLTLARTLLGFPRHLSQHVGGFVIARGLLEELVPIENAAMADRTVIQWDKDDLDALGLLKVDVLGLGMLTAIRRGFDLVERFRGHALDARDRARRGPGGLRHDLPRRHDRRLPDRVARADGDAAAAAARVVTTISSSRSRSSGPVRSRATWCIPTCAAAAAPKQVTYPSPEVEERAQAHARRADLPGAGDAARDRRGRLHAGRGRSAAPRDGGLEAQGRARPFEERLIRGMRERGYTEEFARRIFQQILGFGEYGFPESHAASFALLVYVSAWLKRHEPAAFAAALINSQPMGFYAPSQIVQDAQRHGVEVRPVDVRMSDWDCTLERDARRPSRRCGSGCGWSRVSRRRRRNDSSRRVARAAVSRVHRISPSERGSTGASSAASRRPARLAALAGHRHRAAWHVAGVEAPLPLLPQPRIAEGIPLLRAPREGEDIVADYAHTGLTLRRHPVALLRSRLEERGFLSAARLRASAERLDRAHGRDS